MAKLKEYRECPYCNEYVREDDPDGHYSHTKRHTKQFFHERCWREEMRRRKTYDRHDK